MSTLLNPHQLHQCQALLQRLESIRRSVQTFNALAREAGLQVPVLCLTTPPINPTLDDERISDALDRMILRHHAEEIKLLHPEIAAQAEKEREA